MSATGLIRLYPRRWRERYGDELAALVAERPLGPHVVFDLLAGALDAHLERSHHAHLTRASAGGSTMRWPSFACTTPTMSRAEALRRALLTIGITVAISSFYIWVNRMWGDRLWIEALGIASFPLAYMALAIPTCWRERSLAGRVLRIGTLAVLIYLGSLLAAWI
jgi:hypothetical protein